MSRLRWFGTAAPERAHSRTLTRVTERSKFRQVLECARSGAAFPLIALLCINICAALPQPIAPWKMELIAEAPAIRHPSVVACAPDGRVFVAEDPMDIITSADKTLGRIVCFHPDGKRTVFAENLHAVFGMQYLEGKLYVLHNPKFSVFVDDNSVAGKREELIESTNPNPWALDWNDHVPANFKLAMDGFFYVAVGDKGLYKARGRDGNEVNLHGGGIVRIRPDGAGLEIVCTGVRNILDVALNDEDEMFTYDNTDEHQWMGRVTHMVEGGYYGYPYDFIPQRPYTLWMMADYGPGAATAAMCYTEDVLPKEFHNDLFLADFGKRQLMRVKMKREGATYIPVFKQDLFPDPPEDFRPVGITWGADGKSIYICDWQHRDTKEDVSVGRLWKMTYGGELQNSSKPSWYISLAQTNRNDISISELVSALSHRSKSVRLTAQRALSRRKEIAFLEFNRLGKSATDLTKIHLLWAADGAEPFHGRILSGELISSENPALIRQGLRRQVIHKEPLEIADAKNPLTSRDASIRFYAATMYANGGIYAPKILLKGLGDQDTFVRYAAFHSMNLLARGHPEHWKEILSQFSSSDAKMRQSTLFAVRETYDTNLLNATLQFLEATENARSRKAALQVLVEMHHKYPEWKGEWWAYHPALAPPPRKTVAWEGTAKVIEILTKHLSAEPELAAIAVEGLGEANEVESAPRIRSLLGEAKDRNLKLACVRALTRLKDLESAPAVAKILAGGGDEEILLAGIEAEKEFGSSAPLKLIANTGSGKIQVAAIQALASIGGNDAEETLKGLLASSKADTKREVIKVAGKFKGLRPALMEAARVDETHSEALIALADKPDVDALDLFLAGLTEKNVSVREAARRGISGIQKQALPVIEAKIDLLSGEQIAQLRTIYKESAKESKLFTGTTKVLEANDYVAYATTHDGKAERGRAIFANTQGVACIKCHRVGNDGGMIGPDLSTAGKQFPRATLIESVVFPSKVIREGYQQTTLETKDDDTITGLNKGETPDEVRILNSEGQLVSVPKAKIKSTQVSQISMMPEGLCLALTVEEFADLIAYLQSLK